MDRPALGNLRLPGLYANTAVARSMVPVGAAVGAGGGIAAVSLRRFFPQFVLLYRVIKSFFFPPKKKLHTDRLSSPEELADITTSEMDGTSLLMGVTPDNRFLCVRPTEKQSELGNILVDARTRGGKGILAQPQILTWKHSAIINDIKKELRNKTAGKKAQEGKVYTIDPNGFGHRYDPFAGKKTYKDLKSAAAILLYDPNEQNPIFTRRATVMLAQLLVAAQVEQAHAAPKDKTRFVALPYVRQMLSLGLYDVVVHLQKLSLQYALYPNLATKFLDTSFAQANFQDKFLIDCWSTLTTHMDDLLSESVVKCFSGSDFTAEEIMRGDTPVTVYLCWSEQDLISLSPMVKLVCNSLMGELKTVHDTTQGKNCKPVLFMVDELAYTKIPDLHVHVATVVGRGITLWMAIQDPSQLAATYGFDNAQTILANCDAHLRYRPALFKTAKDISEWLGFTSEFAHSKSLHKGEEFSEGEAETAVHNMTAQDVKGMDDEDIFIDFRNKRPIQAKRIDIRNFPELLAMTNIAPPPLLPIPDIPHVAEQGSGETQLGYISPDN
jgi:type IV secretory pathway TraG/TraD family ATPase VirD4